MSIFTIIKVIKQSTSEKMKNGLLLLISPGILFLSEFLFYHLKIYEEYTSLIIILNGMVFGFLTNKMIISTMSKKEPEILSHDAVVYFVIIVVSHYIPFAAQVFLTFVFCVIITIRYFRYVISITLQLLDYFNIKF